MAKFFGPPGAPLAQAPRRTLLFSLVAASVLFLFPLLAAPLAGARGGAGWRSLGLRGETVLSLTVVSGEDGALLFAQTPSGLWRRPLAEDGAIREWTRIDIGLPHSTLGAPLLAAWRNVPGRPLQLYALAGRTDARQLFRSDDGGSTWRSVGPAPGQSLSPAMVVLPGLGENSDVIIIATQTRVQRSLDGGATWSPGGEWPVEEGEAEPVIKLAAEATGPDRLLALERSGRLWFSDSGGLSWHDVGGDRRHVALATAPYFRLGIWAAAESDLIRSEDDGENWSSYPHPGTERRVFGQRDVLALAVDPRVPETVYAAVSGGAVYRLGSGEAVWQPLGAPPASKISHLAVDPNTRAALYAGTDDGVWMRPVVADQPTVTPSPAATLEPTITPSPVPTETATPTVTPTSSPTPTATATPTSTATLRPTDTPTATATSTATPTLRPTRRPANTNTPTATVQVTPTAGPIEPPRRATEQPGPTTAPPPVITVLPR